MNGVSDDGESNTGNWSTAKDFTRKFVTEKLSKYETDSEIARFGFNDIQGLYMDNYFKTKNRIHYLNKCYMEIRKTLDGTYFAMASDLRKKYYDENYILLDYIEELLPLTFKTEKDDASNTEKIFIEEDLFMTILCELDELAKLIKEPLDKRGLILPYSEHISDDELEEEFIEDE